AKRSVVPARDNTLTPTVRLVAPAEVTAMARSFVLAVCLSLAVVAPVLAWPAAGTDAHGDPLPDGALARLGTLRFRGPWWQGPWALSGDGRTMVEAVGSHVWVQDALTGQELRSFRLDVAVGSFALSPDGGVLAFTSRDEIGLCDAVTGKQLRHWT